jgi:DNA mismatch repair protein MutH
MTTERELWKELQEHIVIGHLRDANAIIIEWLELKELETLKEAKDQYINTHFGEDKNMIFLDWLEAKIGELK